MNTVDTSYLVSSKTTIIKVFVNRDYMGGGKDFFLSMMFNFHTHKTLFIYIYNEEKI